MAAVVNLGSAFANKALFWALLGLYVAAMFVYIPRVYGYGTTSYSAVSAFAAGYLVALVFASAGLIALVALLWEHRLPWPLSSLYASAWVNDLLVLCIMVGVLNVMHRSLPPTYHERPWWPYLAATLAILGGIVFQFVIDAGYPFAVAWSPTHAAHSFGAVVIFTYLLLRGAPVLIFSDRGFKAIAHGDPIGITLCLVVVLGMVAFFAMFPVMDVRILHTYPWGAHGPYLWEQLRLAHKLTPQNPGWMPEILMKNASRYLNH